MKDDLEIMKKQRKVQMKLEAQKTFEEKQD